MRSPVFNGCGSSPDKTYFQMPVHHIHNSVKNDPVLQGNRLYGPYLRPVVYGHFPISSELEPPTPDRCLILSTAFGTSASILRPAKLRFRLLLRNTVFMASSILESSTISSIILSSLHMIIKLAFNSPGRASSKKIPTKPHCPALYFSPFQP